MGGTDKFARQFNFFKANNVVLVLEDMVKELLFTIGFDNPNGSVKSRADDDGSPRGGLDIMLKLVVF